MQKIVNSGKEAMEKIKAGVDLVANPVKSTIGPKGRLVLIAESYVSDYNINSLPVTATKDGYSASKSISSPDPQIQVGVRLIQESVEKQMLDAGDATSTCALLTQAILDGGLKLIDEGASHVEVVKGINAAIEYVVGELKKMSTPVDNDVEKIRQVAITCSNGDESIGNLIAEAFSKIGSDGVINIEEAKGVSTTVKISDGIKFHRGWASRYFVTNKAKDECVLENPYILIYDRPITQLNDKLTGGGLMPILEKILSHEQQTKIKRPLMIFCDAADGDALATLTFNNGLFSQSTGNQGLRSCVVEMAFLGQYKKDFMEDIAAATGGYFVNDLKGDKLEKITLQQLGQAAKIIVSKEAEKGETVIIGGLKDEKIFNNLVDGLKQMEEKEEAPEAKDLIKRRLARLKGSVAILSVGATTDVEMKEKKDRADDAVRATRSAIEEGTIPGGGTAFIKIISKIKLGTIATDIARGKNLIYSSIAMPLQQILENAAIGDWTNIYNQVYSGQKNIGYNAKTGQIEDLVLAGVIEPTKSNRCALQNAASVVCQILSSQYTITDCL
jgi:chaperonin GroEL